MKMRTVDSHAAFFKPYLDSQMHLLDCGCGPGTITLGFAQLLALGRVAGIDREISQVRLAQQTAAEHQIQNACFLEGRINALPFEPATFDAVFAHAILEHVQEPVSALRELLRVLKPGGVIGVRSPDWGGFLIAPSNPTLEQAVVYYKQLHQANGGNPYIGRALKALLRQAKFTQIQASASYQCYQPLSLITDYLALQIEASETETAINAATESPRAMSRALREWSQHPDGVFAQAWCEVVGYKPA